MLGLVVGDHGVVLVVDGTGVSLVLELDVGLLLVVLLVVRVEVSGVIDNGSVLVNDVGIVVVLVMGHALNEVMGLLMFVVLVLVMVVMMVIVMELMSILVMHVVSVLLVVNWLVMSLDFVNHSGLVMSVGVMVLGVMVLGVVGQNFVLLSVSVMSSLVMRGVMTVMVVVWGLDLVDVLVHGVVVGESVVRDLVLHLSAEENLGKGETDRVTVLVEVLVLPLGLSVHDFVMNILSVHDKVVLNVEEEVPGVCESFGHLAELVKISSDGSLALFELVRDVVNDVTEVLNSVKHSIERSVLKLILNTTKALPDVLGISQALNTMRNFSLNGTGEKTLEDLTHAEEGEVNVGALHGLKVVHLFILLVIDLIKKLLPVVIEIVEELFMVDHLGLSVKEHGGSLTEMLTSIEPLAHAVVVETLTGVLEDVDSVDDKRLGGLEEDLLGMKVSLSHSLDLLVIVMIDLTAMVKHVTDV